MIRRAAWVLILLMAISLADSATAEARKFAFWPSPAGDGTRIDPAALRPDCSVHLSLDGGSTVESHPCGTSVELPLGTYWTWMEQSGQITPAPTRLTLREDSPVAQSVTVGPASKVQLASPIGSNEEVRVYAADNRHSTPGVGSLWRSLGKHDSPSVQVPPGRIVAVRVDSRRNFTGLWIGSSTKGNAVIEFSPRQQSLGTLVATFQKPEPFMVDGSIRFALSDETKSPVDAGEQVVSETANHYLVCWSGVAQPRAELDVRSEVFRAGSTELEFRRGTVTSVSYDLLELPTLRVTTTTSRPDLVSNVMLRLLRASDSTLVREVPASFESPAVFPRLPATMFDVVAEIDGLVLTSKRVDLSTNETEVPLTLEIAPVVVSGVITKGGRREKAALAFRYSRDRVVQSESDETGRYETILWQPGRYVINVSAESAANSAPYELFTTITEDRQLDIDIPDHSLRLKVMTTDGTPISGALVSFLNHWIDDAGQKKGAGKSFRTDQEGFATSPALHNGTVEISASADGFTPSEKVSLNIGPSSPETQEIEIRLSEPDSPAEIELLLPDGSPAAGADVLILADSDLGRPVWRGKADQDGRVTLTQSTGNVIVATHPSAGATVIRHAKRSNETERYVLHRPATTPLAVRTVGDGSEPAPNAILTIWIDAVPLRGMPLAFATRATSYTSDGGGMWIGSNLPATAIRIAATTSSQTVSEVFASDIPYPWPEPVTVSVVE